MGFVYSVRPPSKYKQTAKQTGDVVTLQEFKSYARITSSLDDVFLKSLLNAAVSISEKYMSRDILTTTYENYRSDFYQDLTLERGAFQSLESIEYLSDGSYVVLPTSDYVVKEGGIFGIVCEVDAMAHDCNCNSIKITFKTGFGDDADSVPADIKVAIMQIALFLNENKGDCSNEGSIPIAAKALLDGYKIARIAC